MPSHYPKETLRKLRNHIPITILIADILALPCKTAEGYFRFLCPRCNEFHTATNPKTNLARCFNCKQNFNTIDLAMLVNRQNFREAVQFLQGIKAVDTKKLCANLAKSITPRTHQIREK
jgi:DNA primase